jgi:hypothetical protein
MAATGRADLQGVELIRAIFASGHVVGAKDRPDIYELVPGELLTAHTARLIRIKQLYEELMALAPADFADDARRAAIDGYVREFAELAHDVIDMYTEGGMLPSFAVNYLVRTAYAMEDASAVRMDFDVSRLNALDDTNALGDEFIPETGYWLNDSIVSDAGLFRLFGYSQPVAMRYPERTSFAVFGKNGERGANFVECVLDKLQGFEGDMRGTLVGIQAAGFIPPAVDVPNLRPRASVYHTTIRLKDFMNRYMRKHGLISPSQVPRHKIIEHVLGEMRRLAAEAVFLKAHMREKADIESGFAVFEPSDLPADRSPLRVRLDEYKRRGIGTIPYGRFGFQDEKDPAVRAYLELPDVALNLRDITSPMLGNQDDSIERGEGRGGGAIEHVAHWTNRFLREPALAENPMFMHLFQKEVNNLAILALNMGEEARREFRYTPTMKSTRRVRGQNADFFVEQIAMMNALFEKVGYDGVYYDTLAMVEVDDGRAFGRAFHNTDRVDTKFQIIKKLLFDIASEMGMLPPIVAAEGDQIRVAFSSRRMDGTAVDSEAYLRRYQSTVKDWYKKRGLVFQTDAKIYDGPAMYRRPVWYDGGDTFVASDERPEGLDPFKKPVTVTVVWGKIQRPKTKEDAKILNEMVRLGFRFVGTDGKRSNQWNCPYRKEGFARLPAQLIAAASAVAAVPMGFVAPLVCSRASSVSGLAGPLFRFPQMEGAGIASPYGGAWFSAPFATSFIRPTVSFR